jgi:hypothetical protein
MSTKEENFTDIWSFSLFSIVASLIVIMGPLLLLTIIIEAINTSVLDAFSKYPARALVALIFFPFIIPSFKILQSLQILYVDDLRSPTKITMYSPTFVNDVIKPDSEIRPQKITKISEHHLFSTLIEITYSDGQNE